MTYGEKTVLVLEIISISVVVFNIDIISTKITQQIKSRLMIYKRNLLYLKINKTDSCQTKPPNIWVIGLILSDIYISYIPA